MKGDKCWSILAVAVFKDNIKETKESKLDSYKEAIGEFFNHYERVMLDENQLRHFWEDGSDSLQNAFDYRYYQSKNTCVTAKTAGLLKFDTDLTITESINCFPKQANYFSNQPHFYITLPYQDKEQVIDFCEMISIYVVMFYLGSLVRHHPYILDDIFQGPQGLLIANFVKSTPLTFLRNAVAWITETDYIIKPR